MVPMSRPEAVSDESLHGSFPMLTQTRVPDVCTAPPSNFWSRFGGTGTMGRGLRWGLLCLLVPLALGLVESRGAGRRAPL